MILAHRLKEGHTEGGCQACSSPSEVLLSVSRRNAAWDTRFCRDCALTAVTELNGVLKGLIR